MKTKFKNLLEVFDYYNTEDKCKRVLELKRWNGDRRCPKCDNRKTYITKRGFRCANCDKKFTVTVGTVMENTKLPLRLWFAAIYLITAHKKGISSHQLAGDLGITQKASWFLLHRIRETLYEDADGLLKNMIEIDETFVGGKRANKHKKQREELKKKGTGYVNMSPVVGLLEREGQIRAITVPGHEVNGEILEPIILNNVKEGATIVTDGFAGYLKVKELFHHEALNHTKDEFVRGIYHTNGVENFWSHLKRGIYGIYHQTSPKHLHRYCAEFVYRYNNRLQNDIGRFFNCLKRIGNRRLTYNTLISK